MESFDTTPTSWCISTCTKPSHPIDAKLTQFKTELNQLVKVGVLSTTGCSSSISGTFIIPKKDDTIRWASDICALNKAIKCKVYPQYPGSKIYSPVTLATNSSPTQFFHTILHLCP